jgi:hypothetical protein
MAVRSPVRTSRRRDPEHGAALVVSLICVVGLMGIGAITLLSVQSELRSSGAARVEQGSMYAAESGVAAGMDYLRTSCSTLTLFSDDVEPNNVNAQVPAHPSLYGNDRRPGAAGNPFPTDSQVWYQVTILNNFTDKDFPTGGDSDGIVILRSVGYGPNSTQTTIEVEVQNTACVAAFCAMENAQRNMNARNDATQVCTQAIDPGSPTRTIVLP